MSNTNGKENKSQSFLKSGWLWVAVFFIAVCLVGALTGGVGSETDPLENAKEFKTRSTENVSVSNDTNLVDEDVSEALPAATETVSEPEEVEKSELTETLAKTEAEPSWDGKTVYITPSGQRYHIKATCAGANAIETDIDSAKKNYTACQRCAKNLDK